MNKSKIYNTICELDGVFLRSVMGRAGFDGLVNKLAERAMVVAAYLDNVAVGYCALIAVREEYQNMHVGTVLIQYDKQAAVINDIRK